MSKFNNVKATRRLITRKMGGNLGYITGYGILFVYPREFSAWGSSRRTSRAAFRQMMKEQGE